MRVRVDLCPAAAAPRLLALLLLILASGIAAAARAQTPTPTPPAPAAYLRFDEAGGSRNYYVEVDMLQPLAAGRPIRASLRNMSGDGRKLISTTPEPSPLGANFFRFPLSKPEADILKEVSNYRVFVDSFPAAVGNQTVEQEADAPVVVEITARLSANPQCEMFALNVQQIADNPHADERFNKIEQHLRANLGTLTRAQFSQNDGNTFDPIGVEAERILPVIPGDTASFFDPNLPRVKRQLFVCMDYTEARPPGAFFLRLIPDAAAPPELRRGRPSGTFSGPAVADATNKERNPEDFVDVGLSLTSSVKDHKRTTRGTADVYFEPVHDYRTVGTLGRHGGWVQVVTPFYLDAKVSTGKITEDTLALNTINFGFNYEFRHYLNTKAYPDVLNHSLDFEHTSDRDFKQDEFKFVYEFRPSFGAVNRPLGSALNLIGDEVVPDEGDKFGIEFLPVVGFELGRTYRVRDPAEFEGVSRNLRRLYVGGQMAFDLTKYVRLSVSDFFYVRGENPDDRTENYFNGTVEAPLGRIGDTRAAHALFFSFERGERPPFTNPSVNVLKFGYRIRARGLLIN